jgi:nicotinate-nucleotide adenylyltransferase
MKIGLMGGSFDPIHFGHLVAAQDALEQHGLDRVILIPAAQAPLKPNDVAVSGADRLAMVRAAVADDSRFEVSDVEVARGGVSYTVDTARHFAETYPDADLFWIIGGDQVPNLDRWHKVEELAKLVSFIYLERPGHEARVNQQVPGLSLHRCDGHLLEVSSTELRQRARAGLCLDYFVPHNALQHIRSHSLYL